MVKERNSAVNMPLAAFWNVAFAAVRFHGEAGTAGRSTIKLYGSALPQQKKEKSSAPIAKALRKALLNKRLLNRTAYCAQTTKTYLTSF